MKKEKREKPYYVGVKAEANPRSSVIAKVNITELIIVDGKPYYYKVRYSTGFETKEGWLNKREYTKGMQAIFS